MSENQNYINTFVLSVKCPEYQSFIKYSEWIPAKSRLSENTYLFVAATFRLRFFKDSASLRLQYNYQNNSVFGQSEACGDDNY